jgi:hypothetical protein
VVGSQVSVSKVKVSRVKVSLFHWSRVGALTLSNEVTPHKANGRMTVCTGLWGSSTVKACVWSVGSCAKNLGVSLTVTSHARAPTLGGKRAILNMYCSVIDHGAIETLLCTIPEGTPTPAPSDPSASYQGGIAG